MATKLAASPIKIYLDGTAGQSFGVWNAGGVELYLTGDANDYVGKGMAGGKVVIKPHLGTAFKCNEATIIGNTCLYGATGGKLFAAGKAGERFGVRNSGTIAVIEGAGDNACEYMTGGIVAILGATGVNFGAGMTGALPMFWMRTKALKVELILSLSKPSHCPIFTSTKNICVA